MFSKVSDVLIIAMFFGTAIFTFACGWLFNSIRPIKPQPVVDPDTVPGRELIPYWTAFLTYGLICDNNGNSRAQKLIDRGEFSGLLGLIEICIDRELIDLIWEHYYPHKYDDHHGVFEYEVLNDIGEFIANTIIETGDIPSKEELESAVKGHIERFGFIPIKG